MGWKDMLFQEEKKPDKPAAAPAPASTTAPATPSTPQLTVVGSTDSGEIYQSLKSSTDFFGFEVGQTVKKYYDVLAVLPDETLRLKTALAQAKTLDKVDDAELLGAFDEMLQSLTSEQAKFKTASDGFEANEIVGRQAHIENLRQQLSQLQQELSDETIKLAESTTILATRRTQFDSAFSRRTNELNAEKAKYAALLKG